MCSGKTGQGVDDLLKAVVNRIQPPKINNDGPTRALIFDSYFDAYRGVIAHVRIVDGTLKLHDKIKMMATNFECEIVELGVNTPKEIKKDKLVSGEVGWISASIKDISKVHVGDTITLSSKPAEEMLPGYQPMKPMVYSGLFPIEPNKFTALREALEKLKLMMLH